VTFPGVNMDIGHLRTMGWSKSNDTSEWVNYNRLRGQYMSALEHVVPEQFFNDPAQCNVQGTSTPNPALPACPQGVSAVKAIAIAASQGQRVYTITPQVYASNPAIVQNQLAAHSQSTRERVQGYLDAGWEVAIHQSPITQSGWTGAGFTVIDPTTGAGGYLIEGGSNGGTIFATFMSFIVVGLAVAAAFAAGLPTALLALGLLFLNILGLISAIDRSDSSEQFSQAHLFAALTSIIAFLGLLFALAGAGLAITSMFWIPAVILVIMRYAEFPPSWLQWIVERLP
jgi:hypothetical protein